jgi:hypothetical protein
MFFLDPGSDFFSIPDPNRLQPGSRILIKDLSNLSPKKAKKWFISSKTYHPGGSFRLPQSKWHPIPDLGPWIRYTEENKSHNRVSITMIKFHYKNVMFLSLMYACLIRGSSSSSSSSCIINLRHICGTPARIRWNTKLTKICL